jgi:hypothetical protein
LNTVMNARGFRKGGEFLASWVTITFWRRTLLGM